MSSPALLVRLRPTGPWRLTNGSGGPDRAGGLLHSDTLYSALCGAMRQLGFLGDWLHATVESESPLLRISSAYPFTGQILFVAPPRHAWPPAMAGKVRWKAARFVPISLVSSLLRDEDLNQDRWTADPSSECLLPIGKHGAASPPFRVTARTTAPVDRITLRSEHSYSTTCVEFGPGSGMWCVVAFADNVAREAWMDRLRGAFRYLADSGIGGGKSRGWGHSRAPQFQDVTIPEFFHTSPAEGEGEQRGYWLLSLFAPASQDAVDWKRGDYSVVTRQGRASNGGMKQASKMIEEGSVIFAASAPVGMAHDVAVEGAEHPVYRNGLALAVPIVVQHVGLKYRSAFAVAEEAPEAPIGDPSEPAESPIGEPEPTEAPREEPPMGDEPDETPPAEPPVEIPNPDENPSGDPPQRQPEPDERPDEEPAQDPTPIEPPTHRPPLETPGPDETPSPEPPVQQPTPVENPSSEPPVYTPLPQETPSSEPPQTIPSIGDDPRQGGMT